jgi:fructose-1,6-bisphosphatase
VLRQVSSVLLQSKSTSTALGIDGKFSILYNSSSGTAAYTSVVPKFGIDDFPSEFK